MKKFLYESHAFFLMYIFGPFWLINFVPSFTYINFVYYYLFVVNSNINFY